MGLFGYGPGQFPPWNHQPKACDCDARKDAHRRGAFLPTFPDGRWSFVAGPFRRPVTRVRWEAPERSRAWEDHHGEPYRWHCCPWCGGELPGCTSAPASQADGLSDPEGD